MNSRQIITLVVVTVAALVAGYFIGVSREGLKSEGQISLNSQTDSLNYFLGLSWGYSLEQAPWDTDAELISSGFTHVINETTEYDQMMTQTMFQELFARYSERDAMALEAEANENLEKGIAFLEENGKKEGVVTTESGLQYEVITEGSGARPAETDCVSVFYEGTLIDGTVFDGNFETGEPVVFKLDRVISGWTEGVQLMTVGSTYRFFLPSNLGYGSMGAGPIPANSVLIFKVELLEII